MILAKAHMCDVPAVAALMNRAYRDVGSGASWNTEGSYMGGDRTSESLLLADIAHKPDASLLISHSENGGIIQGSVWLEPIGLQLWYLGSLVVEPRLQNGGIGRQLLKAAETWVYERGGREIKITVINVRKTLIDWYLRRGYHLTGETEPFPYGDTRFGIPKRDDLSFLVFRKCLVVPRPKPS